MIPIVLCFAGPQKIKNQKQIQFYQWEEDKEYCRFWGKVSLTQCYIIAVHNIFKKKFFNFLFWINSEEKISYTEGWRGGGGQSALLET